MTQKDFSKVIDAWLLEFGLSKISKWTLSVNEEDACVTACREVNIDGNKIRFYANCDTHNDDDSIHNAVIAIAKEMENHLI